MKKHFLLFSIIFVVLVAKNAVAANGCAELLSGIAKRADVVSKPKLKVDGTDGLIAYMATLLEHQIIGDPELLRLIDGLEKGEVSNPIHEEQAWISSAAMIHREEIQEYIKGTELDQRKLFEWSKRSLKEKERVRVAREETQVETQDIHHKVEFNPVPPGSFQMGEGQHRVTVNLTHPFEMMSTAVTQKMWVELMGENPSQFVDGDQTMVVTVKGKAIKMQPDNPVEMVTWWSVVEYANRMSVKAGLKPAYDLSGVRFKQGTSAEAGTLQAESGDIKINAPNGDIYQAEGFRLPTEAESEYMMRAAGKANGKYHFGDNEAHLKDYAWYSDNSDQKTHPVAELKPLTIDGRDFYDLHGNVWEWVHDWYASDLKGGDNPQGPTTGSVRVVRGGGWSYGARDLRSAGRNGGSPGGRSSGLGLRLVRTKL